MLRNSSPFLLLRVRQQGKMGERECCNTTITFTKNNIMAIMIRNITLNNRTLLLGGDIREQIDNAFSCRDRVSRSSKTRCVSSCVHNGIDTKKAKQNRKSHTINRCRMTASAKRRERKIEGILGVTRKITK